MTAPDLVAFYTEHKKELVTLQHTCGDLFERVWMESCPFATFEGREMARTHWAAQSAANSRIAPGSPSISSA